MWDLILKKDNNIYMTGKVSEIEKIISQIPVINTLYQTVKGITDSISNKNKQAFSKNNPMNAISQETPVGDRVDDFLNRIGR